MYIIIYIYIYIIYIYNLYIYMSAAYEYSIDLLHIICVYCESSFHLLL